MFLDLFQSFSVYFYVYTLSGFFYCHLTFNSLDNNSPSTTMLAELTQRTVVFQIAWMELKCADFDFNGLLKTAFRELHYVREQNVPMSQKNGQVIVFTN